jgi:hypothetical protein
MSAYCMCARPGMNFTSTFNSSGMWAYKVSNSKYCWASQLYLKYSC